MRTEKQAAIEQHIRRPAALRADGWQSFDVITCLARESIPGASVAVVDGGEVDWAQAYGLLEGGRPEPVTLETRFQAASISKPVASLTALTLVQEGRLDLNEDVEKYLIGWKIPANHGWQPRVTLRQLLSHSAGVAVSGFPGYRVGDALPTFRQILSGEPPCNTPAIRVDTVPGLHFRYSGGGYCIVQQIIEDVTGQPLWQAAQERVLGPAGMEHSTYRCPLPEELAGCAATGHRADGQPIAGGWHVYPEGAAAGLWTTPSDLARLLVLLEKTLRGEGEPILAQSLLQEMLSPQIRTRDIGLVGQEGLGFFLTGEGDDIYYGHGGSNEGFRARVIARKGKGQAAVIMTNSDNGWSINEDWMNTVALAYGWTSFAHVPPQAVELAPAAFDGFIGQYQLEGGLVLEIHAQQHGLALVVPGQPSLVMHPRSAERFFLTQLDAEIQFQLENGICNGLTLHQNGEGWKAVRL